ncbi:hypothetical protein [Oryza sativa Japonica Group]|uniref:Uncharacterized protein n=1 Tax=Oryza sativa subsp. japonica TaxID=39947 RepID=Q5ZAR1_ORYSJ|nr:hypothetical protein [Oryza sativa Japonica Group]BAD53322.1 hypothetical protein [Oryza sativa Japonica Group]
MLNTVLMKILWDTGVTSTFLELGPDFSLCDGCVFLGARLAWTNRDEVLVLRVRRHDRTHVLQPYLQHVEFVADGTELQRRELHLFANTGVDGSTRTPRWASARFLGHDIDLSRAGIDDLRALLLHTTPRSLILVEDLDQFLQGGSRSRFLQGDGDAEARVLSFMDGVASCCGEEWVMVFTMRGGKEGMDVAVVRPGRLDRSQSG